MNDKSENAIGVFDSGVGGLTVFRALMERVPFENIVYFGDTARVPYGVKSVATINQYAREITNFLLAKDVKMLIVACNTMAAVAIETIKALSPVSVLDVIDASARMAAARTRSRRVGVIGTPTTVNSNAYARAIYSHDAGSYVFSQACPLFVPLVEEGWLDHPVTRLTAQEYLKSIQAEHIDTLVLGCTHYPLIKPLIQDIMGPDVMLIDSAESMADIAAALLAESRMANPSRLPPEYQFYVTDVPYRFQTIGEHFLGRTLPHVEVVKL